LINKDKKELLNTASKPIKDIVDPEDIGFEIGESSKAPSVA